MEYYEHSPLLLTVSEPVGPKSRGLSVFFAIICVVDVFGVFPIIALPKAIIQCGWHGILLIFTVFSIQIYTAVLLGKCWLIAEVLDENISAKNRYPYAALAELTFGKQVAQLVTILLDVTVFGAFLQMQHFMLRCSKLGVIYDLILAAQNLQLFGIRMNYETFDLSFCYWMIILGIILCPFLWLGSPKDMEILCSLSVIVVFSVAIMIWCCIINDTPNQNLIPSQPNDNTVWENVITAYGIIAFQFDIHPMLLTIQVDMKDKSKVSSMIVGGFFVSACLFIVTTILATIKYGLNTYPNILQGLPPTPLLYTTVLLVTMQLCLTSAISNSALYQHIEDYLNIPRVFNYKRCLIRSLLTILAVFVAESVPKFDLVMSLIGGTLTGPLVFIFPPLFYMKILAMKRKHTSKLTLQTANHIMYHCESSYVSFTCANTTNPNGRCAALKGCGDFNNFFNRENEAFLLKYLFNSSVIAFGISAMFMTTYINVSNAVKYADFSPPCLYNLTAATIGNNI